MRVLSGGKEGTAWLTTPYPREYVGVINIICTKTSAQFTVTVLPTYNVPLL